MFPRPNHAMQNRQGGFSLVSAIFILVILAGLGASMVTFSTAQHSTVAMDIQSARAYQAARAGIEWGAYETLYVAAFSCPTLPAAASSYNITFSGSSLAGFATVVTCNSTIHTEGANTITQSVITSSATYGVANTSDYVARSISARVVLCTPVATC